MLLVEHIRLNAVRQGGNLRYVFSGHAQLGEGAGQVFNHGIKMGFGKIHTCVGLAHIKPGVLVGAAKYHG